MAYQIIYSSQASTPLSVDALEAILRDARAGNARRGVTGALVYVDGFFLQILEGERDVVQRLMRSIGQDSRHGSVTVFHEAEVGAPMFGGWHMAYLHAAPDQLAVWAGLDGSTTIDALLDDMRAAPGRASRLVVNILANLDG